jgi:hypothetical protein
VSAIWTPENGTCFFCPNPEEGYARRDSHGEYQAACFACAVKPYEKTVHLVNNKGTND